jgi:3-hydroxyisobutyrate dehydrogenase-like beta-hydroxyacid dehydrogenase
MRKRIGFVGIGTMGMPMAENILKVFHQLTVFDVLENRLNEIKKIGAYIATSPQEVAEVSDFVIIMLPDSPEIEEVLLNKKGLLMGKHPGLIIMNSSTISPIKSIEFYKKCKEKNVDYIDCPVGGGEKQAKEGKLLFLVGGEENILNQCQSILLTMGAKVINAGPPGSGMAIKIANNLIGGIRLLGICEGLSYVEKSGAKTEALIQVIRENMLPLYEQFTSHLIEGQYEPGFKLELAVKDIGIAVNTAKTIKTPIFLGAISWQIYYWMLLKGNGNKDWTIVKKFYDENKKENI